MIEEGRLQHLNKFCAHRAWGAKNVLIEEEDFTYSELSEILSELSERRDQDEYPGFDEESLYYAEPQPAQEEMLDVLSALRSANQSRANLTRFLVLTIAVAIVSCTWLGYLLLN